MPCGHILPAEFYLSGGAGDGVQRDGGGRCAAQRGGGYQGRLRQLLRLHRARRPAGRDAATVEIRHGVGRVAAGDVRQRVDGAVYALQLQREEAGRAERLRRYLPVACAGTEREVRAFVVHVVAPGGYRAVQPAYHAAAVAVDVAVEDVTREARVAGEVVDGLAPPGAVAVEGAALHVEAARPVVDGAAHPARAVGREDARLHVEHAAARVTDGAARIGGANAVEAEAGERDRVVRARAHLKAARKGNAKPVDGRLTGYGRQRRQRGYGFAGQQRIELYHAAVSGVQAADGRPQAAGSVVARVRYQQLHLHRARLAAGSHEVAVVVAGDVPRGERRKNALRPAPRQRRKGRGVDDVRRCGSLVACAAERKAGAAAIVHVVAAGRGCGFAGGNVYNVAAVVAGYIVYPQISRKRELSRAANSGVVQGAAILVCGVIVEGTALHGKRAAAVHRAAGARAVGGEDAGVQVKGAVLLVYCAAIAAPQNPRIKANPADGYLLAVSAGDAQYPAAEISRNGNAAALYRDALADVGQGGIQVDGLAGQRGEKADGIAVVHLRKSPPQATHTVVAVVGYRYAPALPGACRSAPLNGASKKVARRVSCGEPCRKSAIRRAAFLRHKRSGVAKQRQLVYGRPCLFVARTLEYVSVVRDGVIHIITAGKDPAGDSDALVVVCSI